MLNEIKHVYDLTNYGTKNLAPGAPGRADDKEDLRKEGQGNTSDASAMLQNRTPIAGAISFPQDMSRYGHEFNADRSQAPLQGSGPQAPLGKQDLHALTFRVLGPNSEMELRTQPKPAAKYQSTTRTST